MKLPLFAAQ